MDENLQKDTESTPDVQEGELVTADATAPQTEDSSATIIQSLEGMIRENLAKEKQLKEEANKYKEMVESVLLNDETYKKHEEEAKQAAKIKNATKSEILKRPDVAGINQKLKELSTEIKEMKEAMTSYLQEYQRLSGSYEIEDDTGEPLQIIYTAKLIRRRP